MLDVGCAEGPRPFAGGVGVPSTHLFFLFFGKSAPRRPSRLFLNLGRDLVSLDSMLTGISQPDGFVSDIAHALATNRAKLERLTK
jgi:hypothetical protein